MDQLEKKTFTTPRNLTYTYYTTPSASTSPKPTLLLLHGWPDDAHLWSKLVPHLLPTGHPLLIPDLLGYSGTSKPLDPAVYAFPAVADDLASLLASEHITAVIPIGHDWGSRIAAILAQYHPSLCAGLVLLSVGYPAPTPPGFVFNLEAVLQYGEQTIGYPNFAYWEFFAAPDAAEVAGRHLESVYAAMHAEGKDAMKEVFCKRGAIREFVEQGKTAKLRAYAEEEGVKEGWVERMRRDGLAAPFSYYRAVVEGMQGRAEEEAKERRKDECEVPVLFVGGTEDAVCLPDANEGALGAGWLPDFESEVLEAGHWLPLERPEEVGRTVTGWLERKFGGKE